jgi:hypothetical protein
MQAQPKLEEQYPPTLKALSTPEALEARARELREEEAQKVREKQRLENEAFNRQRTEDLSRLDALNAEWDLLEESIKLAGKLSLAESNIVIARKRELRKELDAIEEKYGLNTSSVLGEAVARVREEKSSSTLPTVLKVLAAVFFCSCAVLFSGDWIVARNPNAAVYNEVSFQKVIFGFAVFFCAIGVAIASLGVFIPVLARYCNPFKSKKLDFETDFQTLTPWQRTILALASFFALLLGFILIASGKLD